MMDGISSMDTGSNGQMLQLNTESIGEVKILTQGYQAEFGRSSGLQITAVTKSGTNQFRGSLYDVERNSDWNANTWVNQKNGDPKPLLKEKDWGYSIGGPVGRPGGDEQAVLLLQPRVPSAQQPDQQRQPDPSARADGARARRRFLAEPRQQRRADSATARSDHAPAVPGQPHSGGSPVPDGPRSPEPVSDAEYSAGGRDELQLRGRAAEGRKSDSAAGHPHRLSVQPAAARELEVLRPARQEDRHARA